MKTIFFVLKFPCEEVLNAPGQTSLRNERKNKRLTEILKPRKCTSLKRFRVIEAPLVLYRIAAS